MKKFYVVLVFDSLFIAFSTFMLSLVLIRYFTTSPVAVSTSILTAVFTCVAFVGHRIKKTNLSTINKKERRRIEETLLTLSFMQKKDVSALFEKMLSYYEITYEKKRDFFYLPEKAALIYLSCGIDGATKTDVVKLFNHTPKDALGVVFCTNADQNVKEFSERFSGKIKIIEGDKFFEYLKESSLIPENTISIFPQRKKSCAIRSFFSKKNARKFFLLGMSFLIMSFFVSIKLYYVIFGTVFTLLALTCKFFAPKQENLK